MDNRDPTHPRATSAGRIGIATICVISTTNHVDSDIRDYPADGVYASRADGDARVGPADHRWRPVAAIAGGVFVLAVIATVVIVNGGDSASTTATVAPPPRSVIATPRPRAPSPPSSSSLPPETVTTLTPSPRTRATPTTGPTPTAGPTGAPTAIPPPQLNPRAVVYRVTGTKGLIDLVSIIYTDAHGMPHTDFNVSLPWSKTVVLNPGVELKSVVATSLSGRLNCAITDAAGRTVVASGGSSIIATCTPRA